MAESLDENDHLLVLEDYFDDEELDISFSNMSIDGKSQFSRFYSVLYVMRQLCTWLLLSILLF